MCERIRTKSGVLIICGRRQAKTCYVRGCKGKVVALCDALTPGKAEPTCSAPCCHEHRRMVRPDVDLCLFHKDAPEPPKAQPPKVLETKYGPVCSWCGYGERSRSGGCAMCYAARQKFAKEGFHE